MTDFWCRQCWRENATPELRAQYPKGSDVPRRNWWPIHCWAEQSGTECIMPPFIDETRWFFKLIDNLIAAGALTQAYLNGRRDEWNNWYVPPDPVGSY